MTHAGPGFADGQVMTVFRSRRRLEAESAYLEVAREMELAARKCVGFIDFKTFVADDGERVALVTFDSWAAHRAWRDDPRHRQAQERGREEFYLEYSIQVGACEHVTRWTREPG